MAVALAFIFPLTFLASAQRQRRLIGRRSSSQVRPIDLDKLARYQAEPPALAFREYLCGTDIGYSHPAQEVFSGEMVGERVEVWVDNVRVRC